MRNAEGYTGGSVVNMGSKNNSTSGYIQKKYRKITPSIKETLRMVRQKEPSQTNKSRQEILSEICEKVIYLSKKEARDALRHARNTQQEHKKPVRSYECDKCSFWHLTSLPYEKWKENN